MNQARNRTAGNRLLMHIASNLYTKMVAPGWLFPCIAGIKVTLAELAASQPGLCDEVLTREDKGDRQGIPHTHPIP